MMKCEQATERLFEFEDGSLSGDAQRAIQDHLIACLSCNRELKAVRSLRSETEGLRSGLDPGRDLWPQIVGRIAETDTRQPVRHPKPHKQVVSGFMPWRRLGIAASLGFAVFLGAMVSQWSSSEEDFSSESRSDPNSAIEGDRLSAVAAQARVEDGVLLPRRDLLVAVEREREVLEFGAVAEIDVSLRQVDLAIGETRSALEMYPQSRRLSHRLATLYRSESELSRKLSRVNS